MHLQSASQMVNVTVFATAASSPEGALYDEDIYELVLPGESCGAALKAHIEEATAGAVRPLALFLPSGHEDAPPPPLLDAAPVFLDERQVVIVQRALRAIEAPAMAVGAQPEASALPSGGLLLGLRGRLLRGRRGPKEVATARLSLCSASALKVRGSRLCCASKEAWASCAIFDVPDAGYFEVTVQLAEDTPPAEAPGLAGRWMLGVVPAPVAEVRTEKQRKTMMGLGYFVTVCHGHPAKIRAPSMPRGTCGEDVHALPGELHKGQTLTLRWAAAKTGGALQAQVDEGEAITLPYAPAPFDKVRPCLVFGAGPAELRVLQLEGGGVGGA